MINWSVDLFAHFLYTEYPGRPPKNNSIDDILTPYRLPNFSTNPKPVFVDLEILTRQNIQNKRIRPFDKKIDFEQEAERNRKLGDRGEKIVMDLEQARLTNVGRLDLANKVRRISVESDAEGFDILSFEDNGKEKYIEVKATSSPIGLTNFYYTANELRKANESNNYYLYIVYDIMTDSPKVCVIENPFNPLNDDFVMTPIKYRVSFSSKLIK
jgi:hypothetical protein